jgi:ABC-type uncharacterized transport system permease subunit
MNKKGKTVRLRTPKEVDQLFKILRVVIAILVALLFAFIVIVAISTDPLEALSSFAIGPLKTFRRFGETVSKMIPLLFTGAGVCFIFSANQTNMAVEGGFTVGALGATIVACYLHIPVGFLHIALALLVGGIFGMLACYVPAMMYVKFNSKPIVSSLMMNYVCMYIAVGLINHSMRDNTAGFNASLPFDDNCMIPKMIPNTYIHWGLVLGILVVIFSYYYLYRSKHGYEIRVVGENYDFATYAGLPVKKIVMKSQLIGGFLAGLGGAVEVLGMYTRFQYSSNTGLGFDGIMVGIMAGYNPKLVPLASFFYAYVKEGAAILARSSDIPIELASIIQAIIMMLVVAERFLYKQKHRMMVKVAEAREEATHVSEGKEANA